MDEGIEQGRAGLSALLDQVVAGVEIAEQDGQPAIRLDPGVADLIDAHPELLAPDADAELARRLEAAQDQNAQAQLSAARHILGLCRKVGSTAPLRSGSEDAAGTTAFEEGSGWARFREAALAFLASAKVLEQSLDEHGHLRRALDALRVHSLLLLQADPTVDKLSATEAALNGTSSIAAILDSTPSAELASILLGVGVCWATRSTGDESDNTEQAIGCFAKASIAFSHVGERREWARAQTYLGQAYSDRLHGSHSENLRRCIHARENALKAWVELDDIDEVAKAHLMLGNAYADLVDEDQSSDQATAIRHYQAALSTWSATENPEHWGIAYHNLGTVYHGRLLGSAEGNVECARSCFRKALSVRSSFSDRNPWAATKVALAMTYAEHLSDEAGNPAQAIRHLEEALPVLAADEDRLQWAHACASLGSIYLTELDGDSLGHRERAISVLTDAVDVITKDLDQVRWARICINLGLAYAGREPGDATQNLALAIECFENALEVCRYETDPGQWLMLIRELGGAYGLLNDDRADENIERRIALYELVRKQDLRMIEMRLGAELVIKLGMAYHDRSRGNFADNVEEAIACLTASLPLLDPVQDRSTWLVGCAVLGMYYKDRVRGDAGDNLELSVAQLDRALSKLTPGDDREFWSEIRCELAHVQAKRAHGDPASNLELALTMLHEVLEVNLEAHDFVVCAGVRSHLATLYRQQTNGRESRNLERAIGLCEDSLADVSSTTEPDVWAKLQVELGICYRDRIEEDRASNLEKARSCFDAALTVFTEKRHARMWSRLQHNLGTVYRRRLLGDRSANIELAIEHFSRELRRLSREGEPSSWAQTMVSLGNAYSERLVGDRADNLERAITFFHNAVETFHRETDAADRAFVLSHLGLTYCERLRGERSENVRLGLECFTSASDIYLRAKDTANWGRLQAFLGMAYALGPKDEELALRYLQAALTVVSIESNPRSYGEIHLNLGNVYLYRSHGGKEANIRKSIDSFDMTFTVYDQGGDPHNWARAKFYKAMALTALFDEIWRSGSGAQRRNEYLTAAVECFLDALPMLSTIEPRLALRAGLLCGEALEKLGDPMAIAVWYEALDRREALLRAGLSFETRSDAAYFTRNLVPRLGLLELARGEVGAAVSVLERGRALGLREALALDDAWLDRVPGSGRKRIVVARDRLAGLRAAPPRAEADLHPSQLTAWEQEVCAAEAELFAAEEAAGFAPLAPLDGPGLSALAPDGGAVVLLVAGPDRGAAVVLPASGVVPAAKHVVDLPGASAPALRVMLAEWLGAYNEFLNVSKAQRWSALLSANQVLGGVLDRLWEAVMGPVLAKAAELGIAPGAELVLLLQGDMALLPLHAAWRDVSGVRRSVLDEHVISYAPSGASLRTARERLSRLHASGAVDAEGRGIGLLSLFNPMRGTDDALRWTETMEMPGTDKVFRDRGRPARCLAGTDASVEAVLGSDNAGASGASEAGYVHLSCHGSFDGRDPERSGLQLAGGEVLSVRDMVRRLRLRRTRWVALSACETGMVDVMHLPDEFVGLPAALLQAGSPGVVATLWSVLDGPTALLMPKLYEQHLGKQGGTPGGEQDGQVPLAPAAALRQAVLWLQDMSWGAMEAALAAVAPSPGTIPVGPGVTRGAADEEMDADEEMVGFGPAENTQDGTTPPTATSPRPGTTASLSPNTRLRDLPVIWAAYTFHGV